MAHISGCPVVTLPCPVTTPKAEAVFPDLSTLLTEDVSQGWDHLAVEMSREGSQCETIQGLVGKQTLRE
ncbi:hypothetical protein CapIbe_005679 [Capra ibex]